jgi:hypothetical protein
MTDQTSSRFDSMPGECTLPAAELPARIAEFDALFTAAVHGGERIGPQHLRVTLRGGADVEDAARELTARETQCCSFFGFTVTAPEPGLVQLDIEVPTDHVSVLDFMAQRVPAGRDA